MRIKGDFQEILLMVSHDFLWTKYNQVCEKRDKRKKRLLNITKKAVENTVRCQEGAAQLEAAVRMEGLGQLEHRQTLCVCETYRNNQSISTFNLWVPNEAKNFWYHLNPLIKYILNCPAYNVTITRFLKHNSTCISG